MQQRLWSSTLLGFAIFLAIRGWEETLAGEIREVRKSTGVDSTIISAKVDLPFPLEASAHFWESLVPTIKGSLRLMGLAKVHSVVH